jgi:hemoglobin
VISYPTNESIARLSFTTALAGINMIDELYDLIGGRKVIGEATDLFYKKVFADESLRPFFLRADMNNLRARQSMFISMLLGGRVVYTGKEIGAAHASSRAQGVNDGHFDKFVQCFREALLEVGVDAAKAEKVIHFLEARRSLVLEGSS